MSQFEGFLSDVARVGDALRFQGVMDETEESYRRALSVKSKEIEELTTDLCKLYGVREALMAQLRRFDPQNPLLHDLDLRKRIGTAAAQAFFNNPDPDGVLNYERAREVGRTFKIPGR